MKRTCLLFAAVCLAFPAAASADGPAALGRPAPGCSCCPPPFIGVPSVAPNLTQPGTTTPGTGTTPGTNPETSQPSGESLAQAPEAGTQAAASVAPALFGDQIGPISTRGNVFTPPVFVPPSNGGTTNLVPRFSGNTAAVIAPVPLDASFKIAEGESPRPQTRAYVSYNFYDNVDEALRVFGAGRADLHRETIGLEKATYDGQTSFGIRVPVLQLVGENIIEDDELGDLSLIYKHAFIDDPQTGNLLSGGLVLTLPTSRRLNIVGESSLNPVIFQPFVGYIYNIDNFYIEGFESVAVPTDMRDVTLLFTSIGVGYNLYRAECEDDPVRYVRPQLEMHLNTPLNHRGLASTPIGFPDALDLTSGVRVLMRKLEFGAAAGTSVTGPKVYDVEAFGNVTYHF